MLSAVTARGVFAFPSVRQGRLLPLPKEIPTLAEYAADFWDWDNSLYLKERKKRRNLTQAYADKNKSITKVTLIPYFGKMRLDKISGDIIDKWMDGLIDKKYSRKMMQLNGSGYIFSLDGGVSPVNRYHLYYGLNKALNNIGITNEQIRERGLNIHAWRHFCNTELQKTGLTVQKVQAITGHKNVKQNQPCRKNLLKITKEKQSLRRREAS